MEMVTLTINGQTVQAPKNATILEAARSAGIYIPTLCYHPELAPEGACRLCVVEASGARSLVASCVYPVAEGMVVKTNTPKVRAARKMVVELLLANHPKDCLSCQKSGDCELQKIAADLGLRKIRFEGGARKAHTIDGSNPCLVRDQEKCILCGRCIRVCRDVQGMNVYSFANRGFDTIVSTAFEQDLGNVACSYCGQCASVCPTGAIVERDDTEKVWDAINDPDKIVIVQTAPSVRVAIGEELGMEPGSIVTGKMVAALRHLGFNKVFDTDFSADLTIMEEGYEFLGRVTNGGVLPMMTSCSPGWIKFVEHYYPELIPNLSSCKSPQQMFGAVCKTYYAEKLGIPAEKISVVSIMPCTAKKFEKGRPFQSAAGVPDIDHVLTTRELARLIKRKGILFNNLPDEEYDVPFGIGSGAGLIFGVTGGVMEAALRTLQDVLTGKSQNKIDFTAVRGVEGIKEAKYVLPVNGKDTEIKVAVASSLKNAKTLMDLVKAGKADYHFIEIMTCPGGCVNGGGQPIKDAYTRNTTDIRAERAKAVYDTDKGMKLRKSHENPYVKALYEEYFDKPNSHRAHEVLHTKYVVRGK